MSAFSKNPWLGPGIAAGLATAAAVVLVWPSPHAVADAARVGTPGSVAAVPEQRDLCRRCENEHCAPLVEACFPPDEGEGASKEAASLASGCQAVLACIRQSGCGKEDPGECYCGATPFDDCESGTKAPDGPCKDVIETHAGSKEPAVVSQRYTEKEYGTGLAISLFDFCDRNICKEVCQ